MIACDPDLTPADLLPAIARMWERSGARILSIDRTYRPGAPTPVFTVEGRYTARGWTEWTQGFVYGSALLQYDATGDASFLRIGREGTIERMAHHVTHTGVHDHGFNNVSTYGNLLRLIHAGRADPRDQGVCELALRCSGAVQAGRWTAIAGRGGYIYSFNGPHSLFADTIRSLRALALAHDLGHDLLGEHDEKVSLLGRLIQHADATARFSVYYGEDRDAWDVPGRVAHESIFNTRDGQYRCPNSQQGYSGFTTWTRGLAWIILGFAELLEWLPTCSNEALVPHGGRDAITARWERAARATGDFYLAQTPVDGVPYWDTGAPGLVHLEGCLERESDPFNIHEPVDSSAAAIAAQGLLRLGRHIGVAGAHYTGAGLSILRTLLGGRFLCSDPTHQGLLLHSVYHRPNGWDHIAEGQHVPNGESSMWGDYHLREAALFVQRLAQDKPYFTFFA